jgi:hypothetical protein
MKIPAIAAACLLLAACARAECMLDVNAKRAQPAFQASFRRIRVTTVQEGKSLRNVQVQLFPANDDAHPKLSLVTDEQGVALIPEIAPGRYRVVAAGPDMEITQMYLNVSSKGGTRTSSFLMALPPTFRPEPTSDIDGAPIKEHLQEFKGRVETPNGSSAAGALVQVFRQGSHAESVAKIRVDKDGSFAALLAPGLHVAFVRTSGWAKQVIGFEITSGGQAKDLRVELQIPWC